MPKIPMRGSNTNFAKPSSGGPNLNQPIPQAAFGGQKAEALQSLGNTIQGVGGALASHAANMREEEVNKKSLEVATSAHKALNEYVEKDALQRTGNNAEGVSIDYDKTAEDIFKKATEGLDDNSIYMTSKKIYKGAVMANRNQIISHEARQMRTARNSAAQANVGAMLDSSLGVENNTDLLTLTSTAVATLSKNMEENGEPPAAIALKAKEVTQKAISENLMVLMSKDPAKAKSNLSQLSDQIDADTYTKLSKAIDGKFFELKQPDFWKKIQPDVVREDGSYDMEKLRSIVDGMKDVNPELKDKMLNYFDGRARESEKNYKEGQANNTLSFMNAAHKMKNSGASIDQIKQSLLSEYAVYGSKDLAEKEKDINKMFEANTLDDTELKSELSWQLQRNEISLKDINAQREKLNPKSYEYLKTQYSRNVLKPKIGFADSQDEIKNIMLKNGVTGKKNQARFISALDAKVEKLNDVDAEVYLELAREEAKKIVVNKWVARLPIVGGLGKTAQYVIETPKEGTLEAMAKQRINSGNIQRAKEGKPPIALTNETIKAVISRHPEWKK